MEKKGQREERAYSRKDVFESFVLDKSAASAWVFGFSQNRQNPPSCMSGHGSQVV